MKLRKTYTSEKELNIPKKPYVNYGDRCPNCHNQLAPFDKKCNWCKQKIDWSDLR